MQQNMVEYLSELSDNKYDKKLEILEYKFKKFRKIFYMLSKHSDKIKNMTQDIDSSLDELCVTVKFNDSKTPNKILESLEGFLSANPDASVSVEKSSLNIVLIETEAESPVSDNTNERSEGINEG